MNRSTTMKRTAFARKAPQPRPVKVYEHFTPRPRNVVLRMPDTRDRAAMVITKPVIYRSEKYRRLVASLPCIACGHASLSQCAHPNTGKAMGRKTDDRLSFPLCGPRFSEPGCHAMFDQGAMFTRDERRDVEPEWGRLTRARILDAGLWPARLPLWKESEA